MADERIVGEPRARGKAVINEIYGSEYDKVYALLEALDPRLLDGAVGFAYGQVYDQVRLDSKTRELIMVSVLAALNYPDQMMTHVTAAQRCGASEEDIRDALLLLSTVAGFPCVIEAMKRVRKHFSPPRR
jgi:4-carboxymuconolactone decarboxylase